MADMKVSMVLSLLDEASPKLRQFVAALEGLQSLSKTTSDSLTVLDESLGGLGATTLDATDGLRALSRVFGGMNRSTAALGDKLGALTDTLSAAVEKFGTLADSISASAANMADLATATLAVNTGLAGMGDAAEGATAKMGGLHGTMKGLIELWGAWKMGEGLHKSVDIASEYQQRLVEMKNMGTPKSEQRTMIGNARKWSAIPGVSKLDALEAANAAMAGAPGAAPYQQMIRQQMMPTILRGAVALKTTYGDPSSVHDLVRNLLGVVETRGKIQNLAQGLKDVQQAFRVVAGTEGKITVGSMETGLRNTGYGEALRYNKMGFYHVEALHEQFKASGKAGGAGGNTKASTISTMVASMLLGGKMNKAEAMMLEQLGLLTPQDLRKIPGSSMVKVKAGAMPGSAAGLKDPIEWLRHIFDPHVVALMHKEHGGLQGAQLRNLIMEWAAAFSKTAGGVNVGTGVITTMDNNQWTAVQQRAHMMAHAASIMQATANVSGTLAMQMRQLHAAMVTIGEQIGSVLLPALTSIAHLATAAAQAVAALNAQFPIFKKLEAWGGAFAALLLGIRGVEWLLGLQHGFLSLKIAMSGVTGAASGMLPVLAAQIAEFGKWKTLGAGMASLGIGYLFGKYVLNPIIHEIANFFHLPSLGGALARYFHPITTPINHVASLGAVVGQFNNQHPAAGPVNTALALHRANLQRRASAINPASLGYEGPVTAQGVAKAAHIAKLTHAKAAHNSASTHLQALAQLIYNQSLAITSPLGAKIAAVHQKYSGYAHQFLAAGMMGPYLQARAVGHHLVTGLQYKQAMGHLGALHANLHDQLTGNAALVTAGAITKQQGAERAIALQKGIAPAMIKAADAAKKYAQALGDPKLVGALDAQIAKLHAMGNQLSYYQARVKQVTQGAFSGLINQMMHGQKTWGQMIVSFFQSIMNGIDHTVAQGVSQMISKALFPSNKHGHSGGGLSGIMSALTSLFSSSSSSASGSHASAHSHKAASSGIWGSIVEFVATHLSSFAVGTSNVPHDMVANIHKGEMIIPATQAAAIRSGGTGGAPAVNVHINTIDSQSFLGHMSTVKREVATMVNSTNQQYNLGHA